MPLVDQGSGEGQIYFTVLNNCIDNSMVTVVEFLSGADEIQWTFAFE